MANSSNITCAKQYNGIALPRHLMPTGIRQPSNISVLSIDVDFPTNFICKRCGDEFKTKAILKAHWTKKLTCDPLITNTSPNKLVELLEDYDKSLKDRPKHCETCFKIFTNRSSKTRHVCVEDEGDIDMNKNFIVEYEEKIRAKKTMIYGKLEPDLISFGDNIRYGDIIGPLGYDFLYMQLMACDIVTLVEAMFLGSIPRLQCIRFDPIKHVFSVYKKGFWVIASKEEVLDYMHEYALVVLRSFRLLYRDYEKESNGEASLYEQTRRSHVSDFLDDVYESVEDRNKKSIMRLFLRQEKHDMLCQRK